MACILDPDYSTHDLEEACFRGSNSRAEVVGESLMENRHSVFAPCNLFLIYRMANRQAVLCRCNRTVVEQRCWMGSAVPILTRAPASISLVETLRVDSHCRLTLHLALARNSVVASPGCRFLTTIVDSSQALNVLALDRQVVCQDAAVVVVAVGSVAMLDWGYGCTGFHHGLVQVVNGPGCATH